MGLTGHLPELMILILVALIIFGPGKLPQIGSALGESIREFKKSTSHSEEPPLVASAPPTGAYGPVSVPETVGAGKPLESSAGENGVERR